MTLVNRRVIQELFLLLTALFAVAWSIARASVQSMTIDEADTYQFFASRDLGRVFWGSSNNHVLNSLLMWVSTHFLGAAAITVRAPSLLGAILYIAVCYFLCRIMTTRFSLYLAIFICLTYNPLVADFMVAARGYGLANAFLLTAVAIPVWHHVYGGASLTRSCMLASLALGLSFASNFSFAFVDVAAFIAIAIWSMRRPDKASVSRLIAACALPGLFVAALICGYPLTHWPKNDSLGMGADSLPDVAQKLVRDSLFQMDPQFGRSGLYVAMNALKPYLIPVLVILCLCQVVVTRIDGSWLRDARERWLGRFGAALVAIAGLSLAMHWLAHRLVNLPLPLDRKGIYLVTLITLALGIVASAPVRSTASIWLRRGITGAFICLACYFLLCLRLTYFQEWQWDADIKDVYPVLAKYNHEYGVTDVGTSWLYTASLNFYRVTSGKETFPEFMTVVPEPLPGKLVYVLHNVLEREFLAKENLVVVYHGRSTDVVVAVKPDQGNMGRQNELPNRSRSLPGPPFLIVQRVLPMPR